MNRWKCTGIASEGYADGSAFLVTKREHPIPSEKITAEEVETEIRCFEQAIEEGRTQLEILAKESAIFAGHLEILTDETLHGSVTQKIRADRFNVQMAVCQAAEEFASLFDNMEDDYMRERSADIRDVEKRLLNLLQGVEENPFSSMEEVSVVIATDLTPSDTVRLDPKRTAGIVTEKGGTTSHAAIIARNLGIPCLVGVGPIIDQIRQREPILLDAEHGVLLSSPEAQERQEFQKQAEAFFRRQKEIQQSATLPCITHDGHSIRICANAGNLEDVEAAAARQIDGIGLFRSEFLYMQRTCFPTEEEQFEAYQKAAVIMEGKEVTIRTLDIGGDKGLNYFQIPREENPFLGYRAIRICLKRRAIFKTQLRAILRASAYGNIRIMFPMIISLEEVRTSKEILRECMQELKEEALPYDPSIQTGIMIETPAAVILAKELAREADFFSIGTNDLTQYTLAVDRGNEQIADLYTPYHPAVLRSIAAVIQAAHAAHIPVGMCGELAGDEKAAPLLLGLGLDEFSMSSSRAAQIKHTLRNSSYKTEKAKALQLLNSL